jgi:amidase
MEELGILELQRHMATGELTATALIQVYLDRIEAIDRDGPRLNSVIEINPDALAIAEALDEERRSKGSRGPLHGIPVLLKDNIDTGDRMMTTAGSLALADSCAPHDSTVAARLRTAGAVILGKTNLSEWANFRSTHSVSGWSSRGGQTLNPYALDRNPCGSSSGSGAAVAANLCAASIGTETDGSIVCPAHTCGIVGIKPTLGLISRAGIVPVAHSQDTAGPMARTVADAAILLGPISGPDGRDDATEAGHGRYPTDYMPFLDPDGLRGVRLGIARSVCGFNPRVDALFEECLATLRELGAELVDNANIETAKQLDDSEITVLLYEFKADLDAYLARRPDASVHSLADVIAFNTAHAAETMPYFGQELMLMAQEKGPLTEEAYLKALETNRRLARIEGIDAAMQKHGVQAIIAPSGGPAWLTDYVNGDHYGGGSSSPAAVAGYPNITVPAGYVYGLPVGLSFTGPAWSEGLLIRYAYAFEQATRVRRAPRFPPHAEITAA